MTAQVIHGDCMDVMREMADNSVDSIVTDPPYGLAFMGKRWDHDVPSVEVWAECLRVLKPGGHLLAFAGTRTQHRMAVRIEDAGFEIRDMIAWVYGSGFPKSHNGEWGGTALKPALEPITMARKPLDGTVESNWCQHGTGALNIDGCRVGDFLNTTPSGVDRRNAALAAAGYRPNEYQMGTKVPSTPPGRWPANLIHDGSEEVLAGFPESFGGGFPKKVVRSGRGGEFCQRFTDEEREARINLGDAGSAARFFYCAKASKLDRDEGLEGMPKDVVRVTNTGHTGNPSAKNGERTFHPRANHHPTVKPTDLMRYLCRLVTPAGGVVLDPFAGSGSTGKAAVLEGFGFIGIERDEQYVEIARARISAVSAQKRLFA